MVLGQANVLVETHRHGVLPNAALLFHHEDRVRVGEVLQQTDRQIILPNLIPDSGR